MAALELNGRGSSPSAESFSAVGFVRKLSSVGEAGSLAEYICASKNGALGEFLSSKTRCFAKTGSGQIQGKVRMCRFFFRTIGDRAIDQRVILSWSIEARRSLLQSTRIYEYNPKRKHAIFFSLSLALACLDKVGRAFD